MARGTARRLLALGAAALVALQLAPAFVPAPRASPAREGAIAAGVIAAGYLNAMPALARIPGGKFEKAKDITMPAPPEDGLTDAQVALSLFVALLLMFANIKVPSHPGALPNLGLTHVRRFAHRSSRTS
ncbi:unnamed protein product [Prorocentrum cordatum]|uniref:Uncharacterized protein n=1 Tax=Prorocentrum cordatum TaxID=2364126 RepID=A0ABN9PWB0_9DINO|nr:unnamed protein product [Polarella glacialis]